MRAKIRDSLITFAPALLGCLILSTAAPAQHHQHHQFNSSGMGPDERSGLLEGAGMGLAKAAETNRFPGPLHVLELESLLDLSVEQKAAVEKLRAEVLDEAKVLGAEIVDTEDELYRRFTHRHIDAETLRSLTAKLGKLRGQLRHAHLAAHLATEKLLDERQIDIYYRERGTAAP